MQPQPFQLYAVQFFSRSCSSSDVITSQAALATPSGLSLEGQLNIKFGAPLLEVPGDVRMRLEGGSEVRTRPTYAPPLPCEEGPADALEQGIDPYADIRWPEYALAHFYRSDPETPFATLDVAVQCDLLQALRTLLMGEIADIAEVKAPGDQFVGKRAYRFSYWSPLLDSAGSPLPVPTGDYILASAGEPIGPGFTAVRGTGQTANGLEYCGLALVWSQSFSLPGAAAAAVDEAQIRKRAEDLRVPFHAKDDLKRADDCLLRGDMRGCISAAQIAVESAMRFYCNDWGVRFPSLPGIEFQQRIERVLKRAERPSYQAVDPGGLRDLEHLYRASLKVHEADCCYRDDQLRRNVKCEHTHARQFLDAAIRFTFWLDSQA